MVRSNDEFEREENVLKEALRFLLEEYVKANRHSGTAIRARGFLKALGFQETNQSTVAIVPIAGKLPPTVEEEKSSEKPYQPPQEAFHVEPPSDEIGEQGL